MTLETYIDILLFGVPVVLLATHWREAFDFLDGAFFKMGAEPEEFPLFSTPKDGVESAEPDERADVRRAA